MNGTGWAAAILFVVAAAVAPGSARAESDTVAEAIDLLLRAETAPDLRARAAERLSGAPVLPPDQYARLLQPDAPWAAQLAAAEIGAHRLDPALIPAMFTGFVDAKAMRLVHDPDVFERLLRGLQGFPPEQVRASLASADLGRLLPAAAHRLVMHWLSPLGATGDGPEAPLVEPVRRAAGRLTSAWLAELAAEGSDLTTLQTDSGDSAFRLVERLEILLLAAAVGDGEPAAREAALEVVGQRGISAQELDAALRSLDAEDPSLGLRDRPPVVAALASVTGTGGVGVDAARLRSGRTYPPTDVSAEPFEASPLLDPADGVRRTGHSVAAGVVAGLGLLWLALVRLRPRLRPVLFRLGALGIAPAGLLLAEAGLFVAGVQPLAYERPTFNPASVSSGLYRPVDLEDGRWMLASAGGLRHDLFRPEKPPGELRIVALGASSVHGSNHLAEEAWPAVLGRSLQGDRERPSIRVFNGGVGGAVSDEVFFHAREALAYDPDLLVLSLGFNDLTQIPRLARYRSFTPLRIALKLELDRWRLAKVGASVLRALVAEPDPEGGRLDPGPPSEADARFLVRLAARNLEANVGRVVDLARARDVPVLFVLQGQNEDLCGPGAASGATPTRAECAPPHLRDGVRRIARDAGIVVVDSAAALRSRSPSGVVGSSFYWDVVHPTRRGHELIGRACAPAAAALLGLPGGERSPNPPPAAVPR